MSGFRRELGEALALRVEVDPGLLALKLDRLVVVCLRRLALTGELANADAAVPKADRGDPCCVPPVPTSAPVLAARRTLRFPARLGRKRGERRRLEALVWEIQRRVPAVIEARRASAATAASFSVAQVPRCQVVLPSYAI